MYSVTLIMKYLIDFSQYVYNGLVSTFSWCCSSPSPYKFPPFCPDYLSDELLNKKNDNIPLKEVVVKQPSLSQEELSNDNVLNSVKEDISLRETEKETENENEWDIISDNSN